MYLQTTLELTLSVDAEKFNKLLGKIKSRGDYEVTPDENEYVDSALVSKGLIVAYYNNQYKKKVKLIVSLNVLLDGDEPHNGNTSELLWKLEKRIDKYFDSNYKLTGFRLTRIVLTTDIDVRNRAKVADYLQVIKRIGRVKKFSPPKYNWLDDELCFCLEGNSNGIEFMIYDLYRVFKKRLDETESNRKQLKSIVEKAEGLLRVELRLTNPKAIRDYTDEGLTSRQIIDLSCKGRKIFRNTLLHIIPFGDFHKKDSAVEIIRRKVKDMPIRRRMLRLLDLIPEKRSIHLAQKALNYRRIDRVMEMFAEIEVSPITISKRHEIKKLENIYPYM